MPSLRVATAKGEGPRHRTGGTAGPCQKTALSILLNTVLLMGPRSLGRWRGWTTFSGSQPGATTRVRTRCGPLSPGASKQCKGRQWKWLLPRTPIGGIWKMGNLVGTGAQYASLVAGIGRDSRNWWPPGAGPEDMGLAFKLPWRMSKLHDVGNYYLTPPVPPYLWQKDFLPLPNPKFPCQEYQRGAVGEKSGLCTGPPVLGREVQPAYPRPTMPFGGECPRIEGSDGALHLLPQWWHHLRQCSPVRRIPQRTSLRKPFLRVLCWPLLTPLLRRPCHRRNSPCWGPLEEMSTPQILWGTNHEGRGLPNINFLGGEWCCILPGQLPLLNRPLQPPMSPDGGLTARVLGEGRLNTKGQKSTNELRSQGKNPWVITWAYEKWYRKLHHPQVSKKWQPA